MSSTRWYAFSLPALLLACCAAQPAHAAPKLPAWVSTWAAPPAQAYAGTEFGTLTTRELMHTSIGGTQLRLRISNLYGTVPLVIGAAHIAVPTGADTIDAATDTAFSFGGAPGTSIPVGAVAVSDPVSFTIAPNTNYAVSFYTPDTTGPATLHNFAPHVIYSAFGNQVSNATMTGDFAVGTGVVFVSGLDVQAPADTLGIVTFGDSITDGYGSTFGTDSSWPNDLAILLAGKPGKLNAVANAGISSNTLLGNQYNQGGLARLDRDVLALPGTKLLIEAEGINDLGLAGTNPSPSAADLIAGLQQLITRAHENGVAIYGGTLTPCGGCAYYSTVFEAKRQAVNAFIRSGAFDGLLDFDAAIRDPNAPTQMLPAYDSGDHLHPSSAGYQAMAKTYPAKK